MPDVALPVHNRNPRPAQGLVSADVFALINDCARRFPGGRMIFDTIPPWFSRRTLSG